MFKLQFHYEAYLLICKVITYTTLFFFTQEFFTYKQYIFFVYSNKYLCKKQNLQLITVSKQWNIRYIAYKMC